MIRQAAQWLDKPARPRDIIAALKKGVTVSSTLVRTGYAGSPGLVV
jgi:hypothetical protein